MRYLGLDLGSKTLGMAVGSSEIGIANTLGTIYFEEDDYDSLKKRLEEVIATENIKGIVLGLPKNMDNTLGKRALITLEFKEKLENWFSFCVIMEDERLTSVISNQVLIEANMSRKSRKKKVDGMAAQLILQGFFDRKGEENG